MRNDRGTVTGMALLCFLLTIFGYQYGKATADAYYTAEPEIKNCPESHACSWQEFDLSTGRCIQNCQAEAR